MKSRPRWRVASDATLHEAAHLSLLIGKAIDALGWAPRLNIDEAIVMTAAAYRTAIDGGDSRAVVLAQIADYGRRLAPVVPSTRACVAALAS